MNKSSAESLLNATTRNTDNRSKPVVLPNELPEESIVNGEDNQPTLPLEKSCISIDRKAEHQAQPVESPNDSPKANFGSSDTMLGKQPALTTDDVSISNIDSDADQPRQALTSPGYGPNQISKEASIEIDRSSHHVATPLDLSPFGEVIKECTLEVNHPNQPPVAKKGNFKTYDHSNFRLTTGDEEDEDEDPCLSMIAEGKGGKCELRHHAHWGVSAARYSTHRSGVILCSTTLCLGTSPDIKTSTVLQIIHTSYAMPITAGAGGGRNKLFGKTPLLQITWCRNNRQSSSDDEDAYLLWAHVRRRNKEQRYKLGPVQRGNFFNLDIWIVYDADSERFELGIDLDEDNRLLKNVDDWLTLTPTSYFQMGCQINKTADEDETAPSDTSMQMLFKKIDINIPTGEPIDEEDEEDTDDDSDEDDEESDDDENDDSDDYEDDNSMAEISVESSDGNEWEEEVVSDGDSSSDSGSYTSGDESGDSDMWAEESVQDLDESSSGSGSSYDNEKEEDKDTDEGKEEDRWAEVSVSDEEIDSVLEEQVIEHSGGSAGFPAVSAEEEEIIEYYDGSSGSDYSVESVSEVTVHSSGSAYYIGVDESNAKDLSKLADRKQIDFVIARKKTSKQENYRGYSKVAIWTDLTVSVYQAVKSACSGTRIFVLSKRVKQKIKNGEMVGYITYGTGEHVRKVSFAACKKTLLANAIDDVLPVTETTLSILIAYEEVATADDEEEELSD